MNQVKNLKKLAPLSYFDVETLGQVVEVPRNSLHANIKRWLKKGEMIQLKKGWYVTQDYIRNLTDPDAYRAFVANKLREPSYLSMEHVLQKYGILTEAVFAFTSVTRKSKRAYKNKLGVYVYRNLKEDLFRGFTITSRGGFEIKEATKAKALFDYLYLRLWRAPVIDKELIQSFRVNMDEVSKKELEEFAQYCEESGFEKLAVLPKLLKGSR